MRSLFEGMVAHARAAGNAIAVSDGRETLSRDAFLARIAGVAGVIEKTPRIVGLLAPNGVDWAIGQLAGALAGKIVVPLPTFFSGAQLGHIVREASLGTILVTQETRTQALQSGVPSIDIGQIPPADALPAFTDGFGQVIYTSGSTGRPKGVRHESGQIAWSSRALADAAAAGQQDSYLSMLPLPLLLEAICGVFIPALVGAPVHYETGLAEAVGRGSAAGIADAVAAHRPSMCVLVPQLLKGWVGELLTRQGRAPDSLRFVAVGGAPLPAKVAEAAWDVGIPVYEGYGLSECCSVVALNRPGGRRAGSVGRPLDGLSVSIDRDEIVVDGPSITDGYLRQPPAKRPWRTGDLGTIDTDGFLSVRGRKDNLIVTAFGRNISPEWIETMILGDPRIAFCAVVGHGEPHLTALIVPTPQAAEWFAAASEAEVLDLVAERCAEAPDYAVPRACRIVPLREALLSQLLTDNGRIVRQQAEALVGLSPRTESAAAL